MTAFNDLIKAWKAKSDSDLLTCKRLLTFEDPTVDVILFHTQQAVEKALKAFLISKQAQFPKTHDLRHLLKLAQEYDAALASLTDIATMNAYAVEIRYPESEEWLDEVDVEKVVQQADEACRLIWTRLEGV